MLVIYIYINTNYTAVGLLIVYTVWFRLIWCLKSSQLTAVRPKIAKYVINLSYCKTKIHLKIVCVIK